MVSGTIFGACLGALIIASLDNGMSPQRPRLYAGHHQRLDPCRSGRARYGGPPTRLVKTAPHADDLAAQRVAFSLFWRCLPSRRFVSWARSPLVLRDTNRGISHFTARSRNRLIRVWRLTTSLVTGCGLGRLRFLTETVTEARSTHSPDGHRVTRSRPGRNRTAEESDLGGTGCSFTYGQSLNDEETYPWLLQEMMPGQRSSILALSGYSNVQSLIQLKRALTSGGKKPAVVVLAYASFHDERSSTLRSWRKWKQSGLLSSLMRPSRTRWRSAIFCPGRSNTRRSR